MRQNLKKLIFLLNVAAMIAAFSSAVYAAEEGPGSPSSASGAVWKNPTYVFSSDNQRASYNGTTQNILVATVFNFSNVSGTVDGIKVEVEGYGTGTNPPTGDQIDIALTKDGGNPAGSWKTAVALPNGVGNEAYIARGGNNDLWGTSWTPAEILASGFGALVRDADAISCPFYIDHIRITVYYTIMNSFGRRLKLQKIISGD